MISHVHLFLGRIAQKAAILSVLLAGALFASAQGTLEPLEDCNCPENHVGQRCNFQSFLDSIEALEMEIQLYDETFENQDYSIREELSLTTYRRYDCQMLVDSIASLNITLINAMGCADPESCNYNPASTSEVNCDYATTWYQDLDGDGLGNSDSTSVACDAPESYVADNTDNCDHPDAYNYDDVENATCLMPPTATADDATNLDGETATINGTLDSDGGNEITASGFYFNTDPTMPAGSNQVLSASIVEGVLTFDLTGLTIGTTYYYQVYVTTANGTVVSETHSFVAQVGPDPECDVASVTYQGVTYETTGFPAYGSDGGQCWFTSNLRATTTRTGTNIPEVANGSTWGLTNSPARCSLYNDADSAAVYGYLYNAFAVMEEDGLCPTGWHVPSRADWEKMNRLKAQFGSGGDVIRDTIATYPSWTGTNESGLALLPSGGRDYFGTFDFTSGTAWLATSTFQVDFQGTMVAGWQFAFMTGGVAVSFGSAVSNDAQGGPVSYHKGAAVRCMKDAVN